MDIESGVERVEEIPLQELGEQEQRSSELKTRKKKFNSFKLASFILKHFAWTNVLLYFLTILSCLGNRFVERNISVNLYDRFVKISTSSSNIKPNPLKIDWIIGFYTIGSTTLSKPFWCLVFGIICLLYFCIVYSHVWLADMLTNKVIVKSKKCVSEKFFIIEGNDKEVEESASAILNSYIKEFAEKIFFVPNQFFYVLLDSSFALVTAFIDVRKSQGGSWAVQLVVAALGSLLLITAVYLGLQWLTYLRELKYKEANTENVGFETTFVKKRELIKKKNLINSYVEAHKEKLNKVYETAREKVFWSTLAFVMPSFFFNNLTNIFLITLVEHPSAIKAVDLVIKTTSSGKKLMERTKDVPVLFSSITNINAFFDLEEIDFEQEGVEIEEKVTRIDFQGVCFSYSEEGDPVLNDVNRSFSVGKINHIEGKSGSGKSTITKLILGLLQPNKGNIVVCCGEDEGKSYNLSSLNLLKWWDKIGYCSWETLSEEKKSDGEKQKKQIEEMKEMKKDKKDIDIFIFDEADNSLDTQTREEFKDGWLAETSKEKLVIYISHGTPPQSNVASLLMEDENN